MFSASLSRKADIERQGWKRVYPSRAGSLADAAKPPSANRYRVLSSVSVSTGFRRYLDDLPHPTVRRRPVEAARHRMFIVGGLAVGLLTLSVLPVLLAVVGPMSAVELTILALIVCQAPLAILLSVTGSYGLVAGASLSVIGGAVAVALAKAGYGFLSPVMLWLAVIVAEAVLSSRASLLVYALAVACAAVAWPLLHGGQTADLLALRTPTATEALLGALALLQLCAIALRVRFLARFIETQIADRDHRFRAFTEAMPDTMMTLSSDGTVGYVTASVNRILGLSSRDLLGRCFFDRLHIADRPTVLKVLSETDCGTPGQADFRLNIAPTLDDRLPPKWEWFELRSSKMQPAADSGIARAFPLVATVRDIAGRIALETELQQAVAEAQKASQSKTRFLRASATNCGRR